MLSGKVLKFGKESLMEIFYGTPPVSVFFLGGAYKSLIHGKSPRDYDLWCRNPDERKKLLDYLIRSGAKDINDWKPYNTQLYKNGYTIEISYSQSIQKASDCARRFDIAIAAMGVGYDLQNDTWEEYIHPMVNESIKRKQITFLKPLNNWPYALTSLDRAFKYLEELDFKLSDSEENIVWETFMNQNKAERVKMIQRYKKTKGKSHKIISKAFKLHNELLRPVEQRVRYNWRRIQTNHLIF